MYLGDGVAFQPDQLIRYSFGLFVKFPGTEGSRVYHHSWPAPLGYNPSLSHEAFWLNTLSLLHKYRKEQGLQN